MFVMTYCHGAYKPKKPGSYMVEGDKGYLRNMLLDTKRSIYEHIVYDSDTERQFAEALEMNDGVVLYGKLPSWFKVPTPLGALQPGLCHPVRPGRHTAFVLRGGDQEQLVH